MRLAQNNFLAWWTNYWFRPAFLLDLAILRLVAVGLQLVLILLNPANCCFSFQQISEVDSLPDGLYNPIPMLKIMLLPFGGYEPAASVMYAIQTVTVLSGILAFFGLFTNASLIVFATGSVFVQAWGYSFGDIHHPEAIMMIGLAVLALSPSGKVLSLDSMIAARNGHHGKSSAERLTAKSDMARWPILTVQWFFVLMYLSAASAKLLLSEWDWERQWANGYTLQYYLARDGIRWGSELGVWLSQFHYFILLLQWGVLIFQLTFWIPVIVPKLKWIYVPVGMAFHIGIYVLQGANFFQWMGLYVVFIPWTQFFMMMVGLPNARTEPRETVVTSAP